MVFGGPAGTGFRPRRARTAVACLTLLLAVAIAMFMTYDLKGSLDYALELRGRKVLGMALVGFAVAYSSVLFHTATHNRILTPSLMGFDSLYVLIQTLAAYFLGTAAFLQIDVRLRFGFEVLAMLGFAALLYRWLIGRGERDVYVLVLVGVILGTMFTSLTELVMRMIDPNEFTRLQDRLFANFSTVNQDLLVISAVCVALVTALSWPLFGRLDVVALGREQATNLGVDHERLVSRALLIVAILVSVSTALVGPVAFLGLLVANLSYQLTGTFRHRYTVPVAGLLGMVALIGGQFVLQEFLNFQTRLSIIISFAGGIYFIFLLYREANR
ncbi:MAG: enterobactin ABC transporter permease [Chloroflexi bacterium CFX7]|nr:enterobactin ABC transporter permease [Chloroflexi bacterium CFX7]RIL02107.1 MAG: enterobactin ABC transporter permease [bacterium]